MRAEDMSYDANAELKLCLGVFHPGGECDPLRRVSSPVGALRQEREQFVGKERKTMESEWQCRRRNVFADRFLTQLEGDPPGDAIIRE